MVHGIALLLLYCCCCFHPLLFMQQDTQPDPTTRVRRAVTFAESVSPGFGAANGDATRHY